MILNLNFVFGDTDINIISMMYFLVSMDFFENRE